MYILYILYIYTHIYIYANDRKNSESTVIQPKISSHKPSWLDGWWWRLPVGICGVDIVCISSYIVSDTRYIIVVYRFISSYIVRISSYIVCISSYIVCISFHIVCISYIVRISPLRYITIYSAIDVKSCNKIPTGSLHHQPSNHGAPSWGPMEPIRPKPAAGRHAVLPAWWPAGLPTARRRPWVGGGRPAAAGRPPNSLWPIWLHHII